MKSQETKKELVGPLTLMALLLRDCVGVEMEQGGDVSQLAEADEKQSQATESLRQAQAEQT
jgi:hypothetical protein